MYFTVYTDFICKEILALVTYIGWRIKKCVAAAYLLLLDQNESLATDTPQGVKQSAREPANLQKKTDRHKLSVWHLQMREL